MKTLVYLQIAGRTLRVGELFSQNRRQHLSSTFAYDAAYLADPSAYPIDPALPLMSGAWPVPATIPRAFRDAAPDRWGRNLISRRAAIEAAANHTTARRLDELDFLLGVDDATRQGALRFKQSTEADFVYSGHEIPKLIDLPVLVNASRLVDLDDEMSKTAVQTLLDMGSASLGGARPKACVLDRTRLMMAKFAHPGDKWDVMGWEKTALDLAETAGVQVPQRRLMSVSGYPVLLIDRFDRTESGGRIGYISAMTLLQADDGERYDMLDIAEHLASVSIDPRRDLRELWRRAAFGLTINNTDDHLRNHGLLREKTGWRLSPAFDLNPDPVPNAPHITTIGGESGIGGLTVLLQSTSLFGLTPEAASAILRDIRGALLQWRSLASRNGLTQADIDRFAPVFDQGISALRDL